ncbi:hypothetical protein [Embleya sp. NPDC005575]|uniref:hypothetical protein n=1 Tax=Embleya sp. NPDC005575 TaxID=3156892 RepID=UPI0033A8B729
MSAVAAGSRDAQERMRAFLDGRAVKVAAEQGSHGKGRPMNEILSTPGPTVRDESSRRSAATSAGWSRSGS